MNLGRGTNFINIAGIACLLALFAAPAAAQDCQISGFVHEPLGDPIPGAIVLVEQLGTSVLTDDSGRYCLNNMPDGTYHLLVTADAFQLQHSHPIAVDGTNLTVDIVLQPAFRAETVVTATRTERRLDEVPVRTELVRREQIERSEARTLADAVEYTNGVRVETNCSNCNFAQIRLLGLEGPYTQLLVDGQPIISSLAQVYGVEQIPARMIENIEVVKGGGSAIYGSGSVGGVVNIIPRTPHRSGGGVSARTESFSDDGTDSYTGAFDWLSPNKELFLSGFGQVDSMDGVDVDGDGYTEVAERDMTSMGIRGGYFMLGGDARLSFDYAHTREDRRGGDLLHLPEFMANIAEAVDSERDVAALSWMHTKGLDFGYRFTISYADMARDTYYGAGMDPNAYGSTDNTLFVFDSQFDHKIGSHYLSWGVQHTSDELNDTQPAYDRFITDTYENTGIFIQDDWFLGKGWELIYGARIDDFSEVDDKIISPRVAVKYAATPILTWRLSVASGFRGPQVFDEDLHITQVGGEGQIIRNAPDLQEESSLSTSLGVEWTPVIGHGTGLLEANLFNTELDDLFLVIEDDDPMTEEFEFTRTNFGGAHVRGFELNLGWAHGDELQLQLGFVIQESERDQADPDFGSKRFFRTPEKYGVASVMWKGPMDIESWIGVKYTGSMEVPHYAGYIEEDRLENSESFLTFDVRFAKEFALSSEPTTKLRVAVGGRNITDEYQADLDQGPDRDAGYVYGPRFPRSWYVSVGVDF